jgi:hypothetical protein
MKNITTILNLKNTYEVFTKIFQTYVIEHIDIMNIFEANTSSW